ncbi:putative Protein kinase [Zostera marina]|uniref:non-specific serine/threonine protein kinase n=1 Tax=Zostera marina TaxID=29655 RepID=A0A0K9NMU4_ZOSMR|nr:putative Protein kinase [Zostera marina]
MEGQKGSSSLHSSNYRRSHSSADSRTRKKGYLDNSVGSIQTQSDASSNHSSSSCLSGSFKLAARQVADSFVSCFVPSRPNSIQERSPHPHYSASYSPNGQEVSSNFSFKEALKATNNFSPLNKIGEGTFGSIYKGNLKDGTIVAFKYAKKNPSGNHVTSGEFKNEIQIMSKIEHLNLVKLFGFLEQDDERIIIVEYVANGNLREHLNGNRGVTLNMAERIQIAIDVSHAIAYLHTYTDEPIIHRDVKASNILITEKLRAKVADFGFARLVSEDPETTHVLTQVKGSAGYLDPEYLRTYQLTEKSDVYSFGVVLVELMSGRHSIEPTRPREKITTKWAMQKLKQGDSVMVMDPNLRRNPASIEALERILDLARRCLEPSRRHRPMMKTCAEILWSIRNDFKKNNREQASEQSSPQHYQSKGKPDASDVSSTTWGIRAVRDGAEWE